jgi:hypothetical protein
MWPLRKCKVCGKRTWTWKACGDRCSECVIDAAEMEYRLSSKPPRVRCISRELQEAIQRNWKVIENSERGPNA